MTGRACTRSAGRTGGIGTNLAAAEAFNPEAGDTGPLCPGNSLGTDSGFEFITNSPTVEGACEGAPNVVEDDDVGVQRCDTLVYYIAEIPLDREGILFGTIERYEADGTIVGLTSQVPADEEAAPEFDLDANGYIVPAGFLPDPQQTEVIC